MSKRKLRGMDAASGGWGFADFTNGKPGDETLHEKYFPCHQPAKDRDYVFTHYAPTPGLSNTER